MKTVLLNEKVKFLFPILSVIAQVPAPGPGPSDEKLDIDDDTRKGENHNCQLIYIDYFMVGECVRFLFTTSE